MKLTVPYPRSSRNNALHRVVAITSRESAWHLTPIRVTPHANPRDTSRITHPPEVVGLFFLYCGISGVWYVLKHIDLQTYDVDLAVAYFEFFWNTRDLSLFNHIVIISKTSNQYKYSYCQLVALPKRELYILCLKYSLICCCSNSFAV